MTLSASPAAIAKAVSRLKPADFSAAPAAIGRAARRAEVDLTPSPFKAPKVVTPEYKIVRIPLKDGHSAFYDVMRDDGKRMHRASSLDLAMGWMDNQELADRRVARQCIGVGCGKTILSEHAGHRMCDNCRRRGENGAMI